MIPFRDLAHAEEPVVSLPVSLVENVIMALNRDVLSLPSTEVLVPGVEHECEPENSDESCAFQHDQWLTRFHEHPLAAVLRDVLSPKETP